MPGRWFWCYVEMMGRLAAEEALGRRSEIAAGTGSMKESEQRAYIAELRRASRGGAREPSQKATLEQVAGLGIGVHQH